MFLRLHPLTSCMWHFKSHGQVSSHVVNAFYNSALFYLGGPPGYDIYGKISSDISSFLLTGNTEAQRRPVNCNLSASPPPDYKHTPPLHFLPSLSFLIKSLFIIPSQKITIVSSADKKC